MAARRTRSATPAIVRTAAGTSAPTLPYFFLDRYIPSYLREWEAFVAAVRAGATPPVTAADARAPLVIGLAAWRSVREGRPVRIEEVGRACVTDPFAAQRLDGKVVVVTGEHPGARRRDRAPRARARRRGHRRLRARSPARARRSRDELAALGCEAVFVAADLADEAQCRAIVACLR